MSWLDDRPAPQPPTREEWLNALAWVEALEQQIAQDTAGES